MEMKLLILFIVMNIVNVVIQTIKSIATIKCGKTAAALINALAYGLYTYIIVLTNCDLPLLAKCLIVASANFVGVWVVKFFEEKARKDKLWKVEATFAHKENFIQNLIVWARVNHIGYNYIDIDKYYVVNFYCPTQKESVIVKEFVDRFNGKYFVSESKTL
jgi:uncharacterized protein YebE (UPF0316 family)